ncbi:lysylphosphatidylglycerol synthase transmembrane domain-containing protein [Natrinema caseinilyticum]|uniref:lysylphosphatidylglycerol synthase transmembrane domain-containing protein n=1 Tax=Natrinema caseinilyticum TaxID=2961570 RepID=UPI0020C59FBB|nr:lysylphosphatidylglycerol synthase transmembrane domain-containing protein [Natrinema caseinilyticum]
MAAVGIRWTTVTIGFVVAIGLLLLILSVVGIQETVTEITTANRFILASLFGVVILWLVAWSQTLSIVLSILDIEHNQIDCLLLFGDILLANSIAPSTYLGGEPLAAYLLTSHAKIDYESSFATVSSVDLLNYAPMVPLAGVGILYFTVTAAIGRRIELALAAVFTVFLLFVSGAVYGWRRRRRVVDGVAVFLGGLSAKMSSIVPGVHVVSPESLRRHLNVFVDEVEQVTADRRNLKRGLAYSASGWLLLSTTLWLTLYAVGFTVPPEIVLFVVPLGGITNVLPFPGGLGSVESVFILLLVTTSNIPAPEATAATFLYRAATYWLPLLYGVGTVTLLQPIWRTTRSKVR